MSVAVVSSSGVLSTMPQLRIKQEQAQIGINQIPGQLEIEQPPAQVTMTTEHAQVHIDRQPGEWHIDQSRAWAAYGLIPPVTLTKKIVDNIKHVYPEIVAKMARDGDRMADVHLSNKVIAELAKELPRPLSEMQIAGPASTLNVDVEYFPEQVEIKVQGGTWHYDVKPQKPSIEHTPARVEIYLRQRPSIEIEWVGREVDVRG
ncbi:hypothetical protein CathTA2_0662 [Caldalkalibacillus thermarum TA2.A1]|uniref:DUF6470 family protein n=1 Tax=Caldalkalibacillus thermarum (strain TA2.A1) TaxID=986075 RepID=F5L4F0_CALTT|nr:DUF6470 family protein [Caldalkalibacillus thermarum]EGL83793.1 hypothetical protein CathTA2_0662 [Caldalkalibacillus thermarum TA2.A1]QZT33969.1 DUF6470 family protein [Caldalkalibacillus thermarum TA2.A1]